MHVFEYVYVIWTNKGGHFTKEANMWLFHVFGTNFGAKLGNYELGDSQEWGSKGEDS